jgi:hypothetical protein
MAVMNYLDLSTAHVSPETMEWICSDSCLHLIAEYKHGAFVYVPTNLNRQGLEDDMVPGDLIDVLGYAHEKGCAIVRFDSDGDTIKELPTHDW